MLEDKQQKLQKKESWPGLTIGPDFVKTTFSKRQFLYSPAFWN